MRGPREEPAIRSASGRPPHNSLIRSADSASYGPVGVLRGRAQQLLGARRVQGLDGQLVHPGGEVGRQVEGLAGGDQDQAVGALRDQGADLLGVAGVVQHDRHRAGRSGAGGTAR